MSQIMLERTQVNSITHPYSSCILLTPPPTHQTNSDFKHSQPHLAAGWTTVAHQLWKMLQHHGNRALKGNRTQRNNCGSHCLIITWLVPASHGWWWCSDDSSRAGDGTSGFRAQSRAPVPWAGTASSTPPKLRQVHH